ncbi:hypothetical protein [Priestia aryabhattai]|uniref:hypothetical protein n=1 Tax=Priestia aryabhattai TaxID=412384 RepID=UPI00203BEA51|nr:hypothetical protein [Priestia aryabhattai]MCM3253614.1 hypothetical protein [Priestia aryabhattai]
MNNIIKQVYLNSPFFIKEIFANVEAVRRNYYRKRGQYKENSSSIDISEMLSNYNEEKQIRDFNLLLKHVKENIPYYRGNLRSNCINSLEEITLLPLIDKSRMRENIKDFVNEELLSTFWKGTTSGSTGTPFFYYRDKKSLQFHYALYDKLCAYFSEGEFKRKARISGVNILKVEHKKPPYWYFIKLFNQLQCSTYHINAVTYRDYINAFKKYNIEWGSGYASAWLHLAENVLNDKQLIMPKLSTIVTDSEGLSNEQKFKIETAFNCSVYQTYGLSEVGTIAVQCKNNHYHILTDACHIEIVDEDGFKVKNGKSGQIVVTDLHSYNAPFIRYLTGDTGIMGNNDCGCGWNGPYISELCGRVEDYILTLDGTKVKRLGHIAKPAKGVVGMQLIQYKPGFVEIHVQPRDDFNPESMNDVIKLSKEYLGNTTVKWKSVESLEKTKSGKIKYVIRKF